MSDDFPHVMRLQPLHAADVLRTSDVFRYYRPLTQLTLLANLRFAADAPWTFRAVNLALHASVVGATFLVGALVLGRRRAAFVAMLAFALMPKAAPIAVLWTSARADLLMAAFALLSIASWVSWRRTGGGWWIAVSVACYAAAVVSKESAVLLPVVLPLIPVAGDGRPEGLRDMSTDGAEAGWTFRSAWLWFVVVAVVLMAIRQLAGARTPLEDPNYHLTAPLALDLANIVNYFNRTVPASLALVVVGTVAAGGAGWTRFVQEARDPFVRRLALFAAAWFLVFIVPVLPMPSRSELYVYFAGFGLCLLAGRIVDQVLPARVTRAATAVLAACVLALAAYQLVMAWRTHDALEFSSRFVAALRGSDAIRREPRRVIVVPADADTDRVMDLALAGYFYLVVKFATGRPGLDGARAPFGDAPTGEGLRLSCTYERGAVTLAPITSARSSPTGS